MIPRCGSRITTAWCCAISRRGKRWPGRRVVTLDPPRRGKRKPEYLQWLAALEQADDDKAALLTHLERGAVNLSDFALGAPAER
ncbi:selenocysteinyl-tRNA-specific translation factor [Enterobacter cancerogenus]|uniref:Selenocysteinyl-tRNA-specific translation factor n=1 Tax=Enterobacter cancerogenus TaxID=69218 RepID=A0A484XV78_9ENTR|nr:selenocysteinyl-tRNA-specific translation factor [Enterobacter cancerogenus]